MKNSVKYLSVLVAFIAILFASCEKESQPVTPDVTNNSVKVRSVAGVIATPDSIGCYNFVYPFQVKTSSGVILTLNDYQEYIEKMAENDIWDFVYPFKMKKMSDGTVVTIESVEDIDAALADCNEEPPKSAFEVLDKLVFTVLNKDSVLCYSLEYPLDVKITEENGSVRALTLETDDDLEKFSNSDDYSLNWDFVYPFNMKKISDGSVTTIANAKDLETALSDCKGEAPKGEFRNVEKVIYTVLYKDSLFCYDFKYPLDLKIIEEDESERTLTLETYNDVHKFINSDDYTLNWDFVYPFWLITIDTNEEVKIESEDKIENALKRCNY